MHTRRAKALKRRGCEATNEKGGTQLKGASSQPAAGFCSARDNAARVPPVQSSAARNEMELILQYTDEGNLSAFQAFLRRALISLLHNLSFV